MGDVIVAAFGVLALIGLALVGFGLFTRTRNPIVSGAALLLSLAGAWIIGLPGALVGLAALAFLRRGLRRGQAVNHESRGSGREA